MSIEYEEQLAGSLVDSFPKDFGYGVENMDMMQENLENSPSADNKPRILLMGLRRSGKSSIQKVRSPVGYSSLVARKILSIPIVLDTRIYQISFYGTTKCLKEHLQKRLCGII